MTAPARVEIGRYLYSDPGFRDGKVCLTGTGMSLFALVAAYHHGLSIDELAHEYPPIPREQVEAAIGYYHANQRVIDAEMRREDEEEERLYQAWAREHPVEAS